MYDTLDRTLTTMDFYNTHMSLSSKNHLVQQSFPVDHRHPVPELHICLSGTCSLHTISGEIITLRTGTCVLIGPSTMHHFELAPNTTISRLETLIHFDVQGLPDSYSWLWQKNTVTTWELDEPFLSIARLISNEIYHKEFDFENVINSGYSLLFTHLARTSRSGSYALVKQSVPESKPAANRYAREKMDNYLLLNYSKPITIEDLASHLNISSRQTQRLVKHYTGQSFKQYLIYIRMANAKHLLKSTDLHVGQIAEMVGYGYSSNFCKVFLQVHLMTPEAYRKWIRQIPDDEVPDAVSNTP